MISARARTRLGSILMLAILGGLLFLFTRPAVREPAARVAQVIGSGLRGPGDGDPRIPVTTVDRAKIGDPVYLVDAGGDARAVAHVLEIRSEPEPAFILRFEPGEEALAELGSEHLGVTVLPASTRLGDALETAIPKDVSLHLQEVLLARAKQLWESALRPELERRLPDFLARIDPAEDEESRLLLEAVGGSIMGELDPLLDDLGDEIASSLEDRLDFLDRMGLLWKFVRGDADGIRGEVMPIASQRAEAWFDEHKDDLVAALLRGIDEQSEDLHTWFTGKVLDAARDELIDPLWLSQQDRLEQEGEAVLRLVTREVIQAPSGGFRLRFSQVLRATLLGKKSPLLLLELDTTMSEEGRGG